MARSNKIRRWFVIGSIIRARGAGVPSITSAAPALPVFNVPYTHQFTASGLTPITWSVTAGALPTGLSLDSGTGLLSGTPADDGAFAYTVTATNIIGSGSQSVTSDIATVAVEITNSAPTPPMYGVAYSFQLTATGSPPITWAVTTGSLPTGLTLNASTGLLSGTPTQSGYFPFTITATNDGGTDTQNVTWTLFILNAEFSDTQAAPIPRTSEPGPGVLTVVDTNAKMSISSAALAFAAQASATYGAEGFYGPSVARAAGVVLVSSINLSAIANSGGVLGFRQTAAIDVTSLQAALNITNAAVANLAYFNATANVIIGPALSLSTAYSFALIARSTGMYAYIKGGAFSSWTLLWASREETFNLYPFYTNCQNAGTMPEFRVRQLPAPFSSDFGLATLHQVNPVAETEYEGEADGIFDFTFTLPVGSGSYSVEMRYRYVDASNYWSAIPWHDGTKWNLQLVSVVAGTPTQRIAVTDVFSNSQTYTVRVIAQGSKHNLYTLSGTTWTKRGAEADVVTAMDSEKTMLIADNLGTYTLSALDAWPRTLSAALATELDRVEDVTWLLRDDFTTAAAAGQIVRRPAVPGPGTLTYRDTAGTKVSIADGKAKMTDGVGESDPIISGDSIPRAAGLGMFLTIRENTAMGTDRIRIGMNSARAYPNVSAFLSVQASLWDYGGAGLAGTTFNTDYTVVEVLRGTGSFLFWKNGSNWVFQWVANVNNFTPVYPVIAYRAAGGYPTEFGYLRVRQLPAPFDTDYGLATLTTTTFTQALGAELLTNGDFSAWTGDNPDGWGISESAPNKIVTQVAPDGSAGTGAARFYSATADWVPEISQSVLGGAGALSECSIVVSARTAGNGYFGEQYTLLNGFSGVGTFRIPIRRKDTGTFRIQVTAAAAADFVVDSASVKRITPNAAQTATADGIVDFEFTVPASPAIYDQVHLLYRIEAAGDEFYDCWDAYLERAASDWTFKLDSISAGTRTNRISVTGITGSPDTIRVICEGSLHDCYTKTGTTWTKRGAQVNVSHLNTSVLINTVYSSAATPGRLTAWPRTLSAALATELERT